MKHLTPWITCAVFVSMSDAYWMKATEPPEFLGVSLWFLCSFYILYIPLYIHIYIYIPLYISFIYSFYIPLCKQTQTSNFFIESTYTQAQFDAIMTDLIKTLYTWFQAYNELKTLEANYWRQDSPWIPCSFYVIFIFLLVLCVPNYTFARSG